MAGRKKTSVDSVSVRRLAPRQTETPVHTVCFRPWRAVSISRAWASSRGLPRRWSSRKTMVSAVMTMSSGPQSFTAASAFSREM